MNRHLFIFVAAWLFLSPSGLVHAESLKVSTKPAEPFVIVHEGGRLDGISLDLWRLIADRLGYDYQITSMGLEEILTATERGETDIAVAALTVTPEREARFDFTQPFFHTGLGIAVLSRDTNPWLGVLRSFFSLAFLKVVLSLAALLLAVGLIIWFVERRGNPEQFGGPAHQGIRSGLWWSAVTMTTVGYGDKYPVTPGGRLVGIIWMFAGIILISSFTAAISSSLTVQQLGSGIKSANDLPGARVATLEGTAAAAALAKRRIGHRYAPSIQQGLRMAASGNIDAFVYDRPLLEYHMSKDDYGELTLLPDTFAAQNYAYALPENSPRLEAVNQALLEILQQPEWTDILNRYLGR